MDTGRSKEPDLEGLDRYDKLRLIAESATLFGGEYYHSFLEDIENVLRAARDAGNYKNPEKHLALQLEILERIAEAEQAASQGKKIARAEAKEDFHTQSRRNKFVSKAYRQVADSIAWRSLGYSRFTIRVLSQAQSPGASFGKEGQNKEKQRAKNVVRNGHFVLVHDATNCLRVGDLSSMKQVPSNRPHLAEIKKKELVTAHTVSQKLKTDGKKKTDKQEFRLFQAQVMLDERKFFLDHEVPVTEIRPNHIDHIAAAGAVMKKAMQEGAVGKMVAPYMLVEAIDIPVLMQMRDSYQEKLDAMPRPDLTPIAQQSNYDYLQLLRVEELSRNVAPYSIFPLPLRTAAKLMTGELFVTATVYLEPLRDEFAKYGWQLIVDETALDTYENNTEAERVQFFSDELLFPGNGNGAEWIYLKNNRNGFIFPASAIIVRMPHEFTSVRHVVSVAEEVMKLCPPGEETEMYPDLVESRRWL